MFSPAFLARYQSPPDWLNNCNYELSPSSPAVNHGQALTLSADGKLCAVLAQDGGNNFWFDIYQVDKAAHTASVVQTIPIGGSSLGGIAACFSTSGTYFYYTKDTTLYVFLNSGGTYSQVDTFATGDITVGFTRYMSYAADGTIFYNVNRQGGATQGRAVKYNGSFTVVNIPEFNGTFGMDSYSVSRGGNVLTASHYTTSDSQVYRRSGDNFSFSQFLPNRLSWSFNKDAVLTVGSDNTTFDQYVDSGGTYSLNDTEAFTGAGSTSFMSDDGKILFVGGNVFTYDGANYNFLITLLSVLQGLSSLSSRGNVFLCKNESNAKVYLYFSDCAGA